MEVVLEVPSSQVWHADNQDQPSKHINRLRNRNNTIISTEVKEALGQVQCPSRSEPRTRQDKGLRTSGCMDMGNKVQYTEERLTAFNKVTSSPFPKFLNNSESSSFLF